MNKAQWLSKLMADCKQESDETPKLKESTIKWTNNGSVKSMKFSQYWIDKNEKGILVFMCK